jgi:2-alkyl-3-oxoalkanoate reductase
MAILVTGGTGLVGSQLVEDLIDKGSPPCTIRALVRRRSDATFLRGKGVQLHYGDLLDHESLKAAMKGIRVVFHCAAALGEERTELFWKINCTGTEHLLEVARLAGVEKFIHMSTVGIYGLLEHTPASEDHPQCPLRPYAASKLAAERKVWEYHKMYGLKSVVLRPSAIIGERDRTIARRVVGVVRRRVVPVPGGGKARVSFVHVKDVTRAMILASESETAVGKVYNVEGFSAPLREVVQFFIETVGSRARIVHIPYPLAYVGALMIDGFYAVVRGAHPPLRARKGLQQVTRDWVFDTTRIRTDLQFEFRYGMAETFMPAIRWQLAHGY